MANEDMTDFDDVDYAADVDDGDCDVDFRAMVSEWREGASQRRHRKTREIWFRRHSQMLFEVYNKGRSRHAIDIDSQVFVKYVLQYLDEAFWDFMVYVRITIKVYSLLFFPSCIHHHPPTL